MEVFLGERVLRDETLFWDEHVFWKGQRHFLKKYD